MTKPPAFFDRLLVERDELHIRTNNLDIYLKGEASQDLASDHRFLLGSQLSFMRGYLYVLDLRIDKLKKENGW